MLYWRIFFCWALLSWGALAWAQAPDSNAETTEPSFRPRWYIGPNYRIDGFQTSDTNIEPDHLVGLQAYHRMDEYFGTGGSLLFINEDSQFSVDLFARWFWPLPIVEPYAGLQISYFTRDLGGLALAVRPGLQIESPALPVLFDIYALARYDLIQQSFGNSEKDPLFLGFGASILYRVN